jgi:hypothetical protein
MQAYTKKILNKQKDKQVLRIDNWIMTKYERTQLIDGICSFEGFVQLEKIHCNSNDITELIDIPDTVTFINCKSNKIKQLDHLPDSLIKLICDSNQLAKLDNLPNGLKFLSCDDNKIICLDNLPTGLQYLSCGSNPIVNLNCLPETLEELYLCDMSKLNSLDDLPNSINELICDTSLENVSMLNFPKQLIKLNEQFGWKKINKINELT